MDHRTICSVIADIELRAKERGDSETLELCAEAKLYAERMSIKLWQNKQEKEKKS